MPGVASGDRRYQVFISSTFKDLQEERQEVIQALLELDCFPAGMELFPASNDERWDLIKKVIDDSDYYIVIVGGRYGSVDEDGISYTEKEYDYAVSTGKPALGFVPADPEAIPRGKAEMDAKAQKKLTAFQDKVSQKMVKKWSSPEHLGSAVSRSLIKLISNTPAEGWVRASNALMPETVEELSRLQRELSDLRFERERSRNTAPPGTEKFARGQEVVAVRVAFDYEGPDGFSDVHSAVGLDVTWDDLFGGVGPSMFNETSESRMRELLLAVLDHQVRQLAEARFGEVWGLALAQASFDMVKIQLVALGLIEKGVRKRAVNDSQTYWRLTPYGETYVMSLHAVETKAARD